jgi:uncharacterized membrane protein
MCWRPSASAVAKGIAVLTGTDPDAELDDDLQRLKQFIERGLPSRQGSGGSAVLH